MGYAAGSTSADDATCNQCVSGDYSASDDNTACTPHSAPSCPKGQGTLAGTTSVDVSCSPCASGKYSTNTDNSTCIDHTCAMGMYLVSAADQPQTCSAGCVPGKFTTGGPTSCVDCLPGKYSFNSDASYCEGSVCKPGTFGPASQKSSVDAVCNTCESGKYAGVTGQTVCTSHSLSVCGPGKGFVAGSASADDAMCTECASGMFNGNDDNSACASKVVQWCEANQVLHPGSTTADDASCSPRVTVTHATPSPSPSCCASPSPNQVIDYGELVAALLGRYDVDKTMALAKAEIISMIQGNALTSKAFPALPVVDAHAGQGRRILTEAAQSEEEKLAAALLLKYTTAPKTDTLDETELVVVIKDNKLTFKSFPALGAGTLSPSPSANNTPAPLPNELKSLCAHGNLGLLFPSICGGTRSPSPSPSIVLDEGEGPDLITIILIGVGVVVVAAALAMGMAARRICIRKRQQRKQKRRVRGDSRRDLVGGADVEMSTNVEVRRKGIRCLSLAYYTTQSTECGGGMWVAGYVLCLWR